MNGKNKCKILKEIRQRIATENDIPFVTAECKYQGSCTGTCPRCEAELAYLEQELLKRQKAGKRIVIAGVAVTALLLGMKGCSTLKDAVEDFIDDNMTQGMVAEQPLTYAPGSQIEPLEEADTL